jgi:hypothetical protein
LPISAEHVVADSFALYEMNYSEVEHSKLVNIYSYFENNAFVFSFSFPQIIGDRVAAVAYSRCVYGSFVPFKVHMNPQTQTRSFF